LFGRSLGGAVAFDLARHAQDEHRTVELCGIMVENTFTSIPDMVDKLLPAVAPLKPLVLRISWDSTKIAPRLRLPMLFLAGSADELVPPSQMSRLVELAGTNSESVNLHVIQGGTHNECWIQGGDAYWKSMKDFVKEHAGRGRRAMAVREASSAPVDGVEDGSSDPKSGAATATVSRANKVEVGTVDSAIPMTKKPLGNLLDLLVGTKGLAAPSNGAEDNRQSSCKKGI
jgi:hypothetical protein